MQPFFINQSDGRFLLWIGPFETQEAASAYRDRFGEGNAGPMVKGRTNCNIVQATQSEIPPNALFAPRNTNIAGILRKFPDRIPARY